MLADTKPQVIPDQDMHYIMYCLVWLVASLDLLEASYFNEQGNAIPVNGEILSDDNELLWPKLKQMDVVSTGWCHISHCELNNCIIGREVWCFKHLIK